MTIFQVTNSPNGYVDIKFNGIDMPSVLNNGDLSQLQGRSFEWNFQQGNGNLIILIVRFLLAHYQYSELIKLARLSIFQMYIQLHLR